MSAVRRFLIYVLSIVGAVVLLTVLTLTVRLDYFARLAADRILANATLPTAREMPQTSGAISYTASDVQILGGRGEGLSCSLPEMAEKLAFPREKNRQAIGLQMRQACSTHDYCYRHGAATYGYTQADCDYQLQDSAFRLCLFIENASEFTGRNRATQDKCMRDARLVTLGVRIGGSDAFRTLDPNLTSEDALSPVDANRRGSTYFEYEYYPNASKKYSVYRLVEHGDSNGKITSVIYRFDQMPGGDRIYSHFLEAKDEGYSLVGLMLGQPGYLPTVPQVVRVRDKNGWEDWLVWWQRYSFDGTGGRLVAISPFSANAADWECLKLQTREPPNGTNLPQPKCRPREAALVFAYIGTTKGADENNFSEIFPADYGQPTDGLIHMMALRTHTCLPDGGGNVPCFIDARIRTTVVNSSPPPAWLLPNLAQLQEPLRVTDRFSHWNENGAQKESNRYRNFVSLPFATHPNDSEDSVLMWTRRDDEEYKTTAFLRRLQFKIENKSGKLVKTGISRGTVRLDDIGESDDPLFLVNRVRPDPILMSLSAGEDNAKLVSVSEWKLPPLLDKTKADTEDNTQSVAKATDVCSPSLDNSWLARPPLVRADEKGGATIFLTRVFTGDQSRPSVLQIGALWILPDGHCPGGVQPLKNVTLDGLFPNNPGQPKQSSPEKEDCNANATGEEADIVLAKRLTCLRKTPLLVDDINGDGRIELIFPGAGSNPNVVEIILPKLM